MQLSRLAAIDFPVDGAGGKNTARYARKCHGAGWSGAVTVRTPTYGDYFDVGRPHMAFVETGSPTVHAVHLVYADFLGGDGDLIWARDTWTC